MTFWHFFIIFPDDYLTSIKTLKIKILIIYLIHTLFFGYRHGAYVRANGYENETAVHLAASNGHHDAIRILINHGAEVDAVDENQCTPLMFAAMQNHPHCVNELLINGADFTQTDFNGDNALSLAMQNDSKQAQRVLENHILAMLKGLVTGKETIDWNYIILNQITYTLSPRKNTDDLFTNNLDRIN